MEERDSFSFGSLGCHTVCLCVWGSKLHQLLEFLRIPLLHGGDLVKTGEGRLQFTVVAMDMFPDSVTSSLIHFLVLPNASSHTNQPHPHNISLLLSQTLITQ